MSLEQAITANTQAINTLVSLMQVNASVNQPAEEPKKESYTIDDVRKVIMGVIKATNQDVGQDIIKEFGADILPRVKEADYPKVIVRCDEVLKGVSS